MVYSYDDAGQLTGARLLQTGEGARYGYVDSRLTGASEIGVAADVGTVIVYGEDGSVGTRDIVADLGGLTQITAHDVAVPGDVTDPVSYTLTIRESEVAAAAGGRLILRVAIDNATAIPAIDGAGLLSVQRLGEQTVALFSIEEAGFYRIDLTEATGAEMTVTVAGDINRDGAVDGADSALLTGAGAGSDINGDGVIDLLDRQLVNVNFGIRKNQAPQPVADLSEVMTHVELPVLVALSDIARDLDGDRVFFRIVDSENVTARFTPDGEFLRVTPDAGHAGVGSITVVADDGFNTTEDIKIDVNISDAKLTDIAFLYRDFRFELPGDTAPLVVVGQFEDQEDVVLPFDYVQVSTLDNSVAAVSSQGVLRTKKIGDTALIARRDGIAAGTAVRIGTASDFEGQIAQLFGLDVYPDTVTILPESGTRTIVTAIGEANPIYLTGQDGVLYIVEDESIVTVTDEGLIEAVGQGSTAITVIYRGAEDTLEVTVAEPIVGNSAKIGATGGAIQTEDGLTAAFGQGQLTGDDPTVTLERLSEDQLEVAAPPDFDFLAAAKMDVQGGDIEGAFQFAASVEGAEVGDEVVFFYERDVTVETGGDFGKMWFVADTGVVGADGVARTASPPFPGLSARSNILVAKANKPVLKASVAAAPLAIASMTIMTGMLIGAATGGLAGAIVGAGLGALTAVPLFALPRFQNILSYNAFLNAAKADGSYYRTDATVDAAGIEGRINITPDFPPPPQNPSPGAEPTIRDIVGLQQSDLSVKLRVVADNLFYPEGSAGQDSFGKVITDGRVRMTIGNYTRYIEGSEFTNVEPDQETGGGSFEISVPEDILSTKAKFYFERPAPGGSAGGNFGWSDFTIPISSEAFSIKNTRGYGIIGASSNEPGSYGKTVLQVLDTTTADFGPGESDGAVDPGETATEVAELVANIAIHDGTENVNGRPYAALLAGDMSAAYVAVRGGVAIIDMLTLKQFDTDPEAAGTNLIKLPGGIITSLELSHDGNFLFAGGGGKVHMIDLRPGSTFLHTRAISLPIPGDVQASMRGKINDMAADADGRYLYVAVPYNSAFGTDGWVRSSGRDGKIFVINIDPAHATPNGAPGGDNKYLEVVGELNGYNDPTDIEASSDGKRLAFVSEGELKSGFYTISVTNDTPAGYAAKVNQLPSPADPDRFAPFDINEGLIGVRYSPLIIPVPFYGAIVIDNYLRLSSQNYDLDIRNPSTLAIAPDLSYAFVGDYAMSRYFTLPSGLAYEVEIRHDLGSKVGLVRNPFGMDVSEWDTRGIEFKYGSAEHVGSTTPIPDQYMVDVALRPDGTQLFASFRAAGGVSSYNVDALVRAAEARNFGGLSFDGGTDLEAGSHRKFPVDQVGNTNFGLTANPAVVAAPYDVIPFGIGLDVQNDTGIKLLQPGSPIALYGENAAPLIFEAQLDPSKLGQQNWLADLYVSTQPAGFGLFPGDSYRTRPSNADAPPEALSPDYHRNRIVNTGVTAGSYELESGYLWILGLDGKLTRGNAIVNGKVKDEEGNELSVTGTVRDNHVLLVKVSNVLAQTLVANNEYFWGVDIERRGGQLRADSSFVVDKIETVGPFTSVNIITHGFQPMGWYPDYANSSLDVAQLVSWINVGQTLSEASGGGIVLVYSKETGLWHSVESYNPLIEHPVISTDPVDMAALKEGEAVTLVLDWYRESNVSDSGFSEAAADAFFASMVHLDRQLGGTVGTPGKLFKSPLHFVGHSRGTSVNSEIIQRLGTFYPEGEDLDLVIQQTNLDPHDFKQGTLKINVDQIVGNWLRVLEVGALALTATLPPAGRLAQSVVSKMKQAWEIAKALASLFGLQVKELPFDDFADPNVTIWSNVNFADTYFQETADENIDGILETLGDTFSLLPTTTPNGTSVPTTKDSGAPKPTSAQGLSKSDLEVKFTGEGFEVSGFIDDDLLATPHTRVINWYLGTADVNSLYLEGMAIRRTEGDQNLLVSQQRDAVNSDGGIFDFFLKVFNDQPWYVVDPVAFKGGWGDVKSYFDEYFVTAKSNSITSSTIKPNEAIGSGFYFSQAGSGGFLHPEQGDLKRTIVDFDNTEVKRPTLPAGQTYPAVPTVYNGDFQAGTRHAITGYVAWMFKTVFGNAVNNYINPPDTNLSDADLAKLQLNDKLPDGTTRTKPATSAMPSLSQLALPPNLGRFPLNHDLPGWSMHGDTSYTVNVLNSILPDFFDAPMDITSLFLVNKNLTGLLTDTIDVLIKPMIDKYITGKLFQVIEDKFSLNNNMDLDQISAHKSAQWLEDNNAILDGDQILNKTTGAFLMSDVNLFEKSKSAAALLLPEFELTKTLAQVLDAQIAGLLSEPILKDYIKGKADYEIAGSPKIWETLTAPTASQDDVANKKKAMSAVAGFVSANISTLLTKGLGLSTEPNFGLIMGGGQVIKDLVAAVILNISPPGFAFNFKDVLDEALDAAGNTLASFDSITHNRMLVPTNVQRLKIDVLSPFNVQEGVKLTVQFTPIDSSISTPAAETLTVPPNFFTNTTMEFEVPEAVQGHVVMLTITQSGLDEGEQTVAEDIADFFPTVAGIKKGLEGLSNFIIVDNIRLTNISANQSAASVGAGTDVELSLVEATALAEVAKGIWLDSELLPGIGDALDNISLTMGNLDGTKLAAVSDNGVITLDIDAAGNGWFVDATPLDDAEFNATESAHLFTAASGSAAEGRIDLLSVLMHEIGNAIGLNDIVDATVDARVMSAIIDTGQRRHLTGPDVQDWTAPSADVATPEAPTGPVQGANGGPTAADLAAPVFEAPAAGRFGNGRFVLGLDNSDSRWAATGGAVIADGQGVLDEATLRMSALQQSFPVPGTATGLQFVISTMQLASSEGAAPDAFEAALIDATTGATVIPRIAELGKSDAFLNVQSDGTRRISDGVTLEDTADGLLVTVDFTGLDLPDTVLLSFDLLGLGALDSRVVLDDVILLGVGAQVAPVAVDDTAKTTLNVPVLVHPLGNDTDDNGDAMTIEILDGPGTGTFERQADGRYLYTPATGALGDITIRYRATDGDLFSEPATITITITDENGAPAIGPVDPVTVTQGQPLEVTFTAVDPNDPVDTLRYRIVSGPDGATIDAETGRLTVDTAALLGLIPIEVEVADPEGATDRTLLALTVIAPPVLTLAETLMVTTGETVDVLPVVTDPDTDATSLTFEKVAGPDWITVDAATGRITGDTEGNPGASNVVIRVTDDTGLSDAAAIAITVVDRDPLAPVFAPMDPVMLTVGAALDVLPVVTDPDTAAADLVFDKVSGPDWILVDGATGRITGDSTDNAGAVEVVIRVTDPTDLTDTATLSVTINVVAPIAPVLSALDALTLAEGAALNVLPVVTDPDTSPAGLTFTKVSGADWVAVDAATGRISGDTEGQTGAVDIVIRVTDDVGLSDTGTLALTVVARDPLAPVITPMAALTLAEGAALDVLPVVTDPDTPAAALTFEKVSGPAWISVDPATGRITGDSQGHAGDSTLVIRVTDPDNLSDTATLVLSVTAPAPLAPVLGALGTVSVPEGQAIDILPSATDPDTDAADLVFAKLSGPDWITVDAATGRISGDTEGHLGAASVVISVTDPSGLSDSETLQLIVSERGVLKPVLGPALLRGPGEILASAGNELTGEPIRATMDAGLTRVVLLLTWDPTVIGEMEITAGPNAPLGMTVDVVGGNGLSRITLDFATPTSAASDVALLSMHARLADTAPRGATHRIAMALTEANGAAPAASFSDEVIHAVSAAPVVVVPQPALNIEQPTQPFVHTPLPPVGDLLDLVVGESTELPIVYLPARNLSYSDPDKNNDALKSFNVLMMFENQGGVTDLSFTATFDPAQLQLRDVTPGDGLPDGVSIETRIEAGVGGSQLVVSLSSPVALAQPTLELIVLRLQAKPGATDPEGAIRNMSISVQDVNGGSDTGGVDVVPVHQSAALPVETGTAAVQLADAAWSLSLGPLGAQMAGNGLVGLDATGGAAMFDLAGLAGASRLEMTLALADGIAAETIEGLPDGASGRVRMEGSDAIVELEGLLALGAIAALSPVLKLRRTGASRREVLATDLRRLRVNGVDLALHFDHDPEVDAEVKPNGFAIPFVATDAAQRDRTAATNGMKS